MALMNGIERLFHTNMRGPCKVKCACDGEGIELLNSSDITEPTPECPQNMQSL